ncbi:hypothetical protein ABPG72_001271 [Tetrahymena utriculariae]
MNNFGQINYDNDQKRREIDTNFYSIKSFTVDLNDLYQIYQVKDQQAKQTWMYIFDYVCLTKIKNQKDCFRKTTIKFYKNYFPEYKYFKDNYSYNGFKNLPNRKNYLTRIKKKSSKRIYEQNFYHDIENMLANRNEDEDKDEVIIYQLKKLIKDLLQITYDSFYNESLILNDSLTLEYCFQQLKYLEIEYFYCCIAFKIKNQQELLERITCILRRYYHFWVELLFETYCYYDRKLKSSNRSNKNEMSNVMTNKEKKFLENNKQISERMEKFNNNNGLCRKQQFFEQQTLPTEKQEQLKNETYEFSFLEFNQQDEFDDEALKLRFKKFDLKIEDILDYYPFLERKVDSKLIKVSQNFNSTSQSEEKVFIENIQMLANTNIDIIYEFICAEYPNWQFYQGPYTMIIQLYSFLKKAINYKSILIAIVETYQYFKDANNLKIIYDHDRENNQFFQKQKFKNKQFEFKDEDETDDEYDLEDEKIQINDEINKIQDYQNLEKQRRSNANLQINDVTRRKKEKISKIIEKIINQIIENNCNKLTEIFSLYSKDENIKKIGHNIQKMFFIFQFDGIQFQKTQMDDNNKPIYEYKLDDSLAFDLQLFICQEKSNIQKEESIKSSKSLSNKSKDDSQNDDKMDSKKDEIELDKIDKHNESIDLEEKFEEKEAKNAQKFYESCFQAKHQSKGYIMPIPYENLTFPPSVNEPIILPQYNDIQKGSDHYFDDIQLKPQSQEINQFNLRQMSSASNANSNKLQQKKQLYLFKDEDQINDMRIFKKLAETVEKSTFSNYKGPQPKQTDFEYNLQQYFDFFHIQKQ